MFQSAAGPIAGCGGKYPEMWQAYCFFVVVVRVGLETLGTIWFIAQLRRTSL
jgi:hypothetical protein